jgi:RNA polymerase sigma-70 factor, ECF subfamily
MPVTSGGSSDARDDAAVMAAIAQGDRSALETLYDRYAPMVYALCRRMLRDPSASEDLLSDVFIEAWRRGDRFDAARGSVPTYLATVTRSRGIDRLRARARSATAALDEERAAGAADDPGTGLMSDERSRQVRRALASLTAEQREAVEMAFYDGLSHAEVAERLHKPLGTVKTHIRQGLIHLRDLLRTLVSDEDVS